MERKQSYSRLELRNQHAHSVCHIFSLKSANHPEFSEAQWWLRRQRGFLLEAIRGQGSRPLGKSAARNLLGSDFGQMGGGGHLVESGKYESDSVATHSGPAAKKFSGPRAAKVCMRPEFFAPQRRPSLSSQLLILRIRQKRGRPGPGPQPARSLCDFILAKEAQIYEARQY